MFILGKSNVAQLHSFLCEALHYDTESRLLIRPYEQQQVEVRKVINQFAEVAAKRPAAFPVLFFMSSSDASVKKNCWQTCTLNRCT